MKPLLLAAGLLAGAAPVAAQTMRALDLERQHHGETRLGAHIRFAAGNLAVVAATPGILYDFALRYDRDRYAPATSYDAATGRLALGVERTGGGGLRVSNASQLAQEATVALSAAVDLDLAVDLEAGEGRLDLGGRVFGNVPFLVDPRRGADGNPYAQCIVGNEVLKEFVLTIDLARRRAFFRKQSPVPE